MQVEQPVGDVDAKIRVDSDQLGVKGRMMQVRQRQAIRDDRLTKLFVRIHDDVSGIEEPRLGDTGDRAPSPIGGEDGISEGCLMQPGLDFTKRISTLGGVRWHSLSRGSYDHPKGKLDPEVLGMPPYDECRDDGLIPTGRSAEEIDNRGLPLHRIPEPAVIRRVRVAAHEGVFDDIITRIDSAVGLTLIVVPDPSARSREATSLVNEPNLC